ncbi:hypothetical protein ACWDCB_12585, partial [Streptomyces sp. NPDC001178]
MRWLRAGADSRTPRAYGLQYKTFSFTVGRSQVSVGRARLPFEVAVDDLQHRGRLAAPAQPVYDLQP